MKGAAIKKERVIEIFSAGCTVCDQAANRIRELAHPSSEVVVLEMNRADVAERARTLGIRSVPAVVVDGRLADCCAGRGIDEAALKAAGLGQPISGESE